MALEFIADFSHPENARHLGYIRCARDLVAELAGGEPPVVFDSFAGGGSIPLEALRVGCDAIGSDLNPLACLILRSELEQLPREGAELANLLYEAGRIINARFLCRIQGYFAKDAPSSGAIAYFWARQAQCESPNCGVTFPLAGAFWLCKKKGHETALNVSFGAGKTDLVWDVFHPNDASEIPQATVKNGRCRCPRCGVALKNDRLRSQLEQDRGGIERAKLLAKVTIDPITGKKCYLTPTAEDLNAAEEAALQVAQLEENAKKVSLSLSLIPDESIPRSELRRVSAPLYGCSTWQDLFLPRQRLSLQYLAEEIKKYVQETGKSELMPMLALAFGKVVRHWNSNAKWHTKGENVAGAFGRQAIPMSYFFPEQSPLASGGAGSWIDAVESVSASARAVAGLGNTGQSFRADASDVPLASESVSVWFTDPPYYDAVAYAHLADFFYVWLRRLIPDDPLFATPLIDKTQECVVDRPHSQSPSQKRADWFECKIGDAMVEGRRVLADHGVASVVFAHKTTEGWEAIIGAMLKAGLVITASWPIATERESRLNARDNAALATSVHLICRPRPDNAGIGDWSEVLRELPCRVGDWMERLQAEGVRGADLVFACIGPALEIYSRYSKVVDAGDQEIPLGGDPMALDPHKRGYLAYVWETVGRAALEQVLGTAEAQARNGDAAALEEDARLTALFLWTLQSTKGEGKREKKKGKSEETEEEEQIDEDEDEGESRGKAKGHTLIFDVVRRFAQPLGINLPKWEGRIIDIKKGVVRLLPVSERAKVLFGQDGARAVAYQLESTPRPDTQLVLFPGAREHAAAPHARGGKRVRSMAQAAELSTDAAVTTLDRVHAAMLLQAAGMTNALRALIKAEKEKGEGFLRLANALSALLKPLEATSALAKEEKRLLDAMLLAMPK